MNADFNIGQPAVFYGEPVRFDRKLPNGHWQLVNHRTGKVYALSMAGLYRAFLLGYLTLSQVAQTPPSEDVPSNPLVKFPSRQFLGPEVIEAATLRLRRPALRGHTQLDLFSVDEKGRLVGHPRIVPENDTPIRYVRGVEVRHELPNVYRILRPRKKRPHRTTEGHSKQKKR